MNANWGEKSHAFTVVSVLPISKRLRCVFGRGRPESLPEPHMSCGIIACQQRTRRCLTDGIHELTVGWCVNLASKAQFGLCQFGLCLAHTGPPCCGLKLPSIIVFRSVQQCTQKCTFLRSFPSLSTLPYFALRKRWPSPPGRHVEERIVCVCVCGGGHALGNMPRAFPIHQHSNLSVAGTERQLQWARRGSSSVKLTVNTAGTISAVWLSHSDWQWGLQMVRLNKCKLFGHLSQKRQCHFPFP